MVTRGQHLPGAGFIVLVAFTAIFALLLSWIFDTTRIESTILLEEKGLNQLYRNHATEALDYFQQSALVDTDKFHHILRYRDSLLLAIQSGNAEKAEFFFNELLVESPDLVTAKEFSGLLGLQANADRVIDLVVRAVQIEAIEKQEIQQAVSNYIKALDDQTRPGFVSKLNQAMQANAAQGLGQ